MTRALVFALLVAGSLALVAAAPAARPAPRGPRHRFDWWGATLAWSDGE